MSDEPQPINALRCCFPHLAELVFMMKPLDLRRGICPECHMAWNAFLAGNALVLNPLGYTSPIIHASALSH